MCVNVTSGSHLLKIHNADEPPLAHDLHTFCRFEAYEGARQPVQATWPHADRLTDRSQSDKHRRWLETFVRESPVFSVITPTVSGPAHSRHPRRLFCYRL